MLDVDFEEGKELLWMIGSRRPATVALQELSLELEQRLQLAQEGLLPLRDVHLIAQLFESRSNREPRV